MINFRISIAFVLAIASLGMGVATTSTPVAAWDFQFRNISTGFDHGFQYWGPGVGGVPPATTYVYETCYPANQIVYGPYGFAYHAVVRVCHSE